MALLLKEGNGGRPGGANGWSMINTQGTTTFCSFFGPGVLLVLGTILEPGLHGQ